MTRFDDFVCLNPVIIVNFFWQTCDSCRISGFLLILRRCFFGLFHFIVCSPINKSTMISRSVHIFIQRSFLSPQPAIDNLIELIISLGKVFNLFD
jgi:hypothetical protein